MSSLGVKLPLARDASDGYGMIKSFKTMIRQNFKMLLLTSPGERIMEPNFGVGLKFC
jgi:phage baseplate assembly protein W